jgi:hypothetical protein
MDTPHVYAPEVCRDDESETAYRPSWLGTGVYLNPDHAEIWEATQEIPGDLARAESEKLYELAYHSGSVILEVGTVAGRSAVVQLRGALRGHDERRVSRPQFYAVTPNLAGLTRTYQTLHEVGLSEYSLLFHGDLIHFHHRYRVTPTLVFVDGAHDYLGAWCELDLLRTFLAPGTPVLVHDYWSYAGVKLAIDQWRTSGHYDFLGVFGSSALLRASAECTGQAHGLASEHFETERRARLVQHFDELRHTQAELHERIRELSTSRWRKLGVRLGLVKHAAWERTYQQCA